MNPLSACVTEPDTLPHCTWRLINLISFVLALGIKSEVIGSIFFKLFFLRLFCTKLNSPGKNSTLPKVKQKSGQLNQGDKEHHLQTRSWAGEELERELLFLSVTLLTGLQPLEMKLA